MIKSILAVFTAILVFTILSIACRSGNHREGAAPVAAKIAGPLRVTLTLDRAAYPRDIPVTFTMTVVNTGSEPERITFSTGQSYDIIVRRGEDVFWRWSTDRFFTQAIREVTLAAGDSLTFSETWDRTSSDGGSAPPGMYAAMGVLTTTEPVTTPPVAFRIAE